jgi:hypothetical protein
MTSFAKSHFIVAKDHIRISVGASSIYMDKDLIHVTSPNIKVEHEDPENHRGSKGRFSTGVLYAPPSLSTPSPDDLAVRPPVGDDESGSTVA